MARVVARVEEKATAVVERIPMVEMQPVGQRSNESSRAVSNVGVRIIRSRIAPNGKGSSEPMASLPMATKLPAARHGRNERPRILAS